VIGDDANVSNRLCDEATARASARRKRMTGPCPDVGRVHLQAAQVLAG